MKAATCNQLLVHYFHAHNFSGGSVNDEWENIAVIFNGSAEMKDVNIPQNNWTVVLEGDQIDMRGIRRFMGSTVSVPSYSAIILASKGI